MGVRFKIVSKGVGFKSKSLELPEMFDVEDWEEWSKNNKVSDSVMEFIIKYHRFSKKPYTEFEGEICEILGKCYENIQNY